MCPSPFSPKAEPGTVMIPPFFTGSSADFCEANLKPFMFGKA
jgi:hypothetical protein